MLECERERESNRDIASEKEKGLCYQCGSVNRSAWRPAGGSREERGRPQDIDEELGLAKAFLTGAFFTFASLGHSSRLL
jgi:hypothetical protein